MKTDQLNNVICEMKSFWIFMVTFVLVATFINAKTIEERKGGGGHGGGGHGGGGHGGGIHGGGGHGGGHYNSGSIQFMNQFVIVSTLLFSLFLMK